MKIFALLSLFVTLTTWAQDPKAYLTVFDNKVYSLKTKGVQDFTVDIESSRLTKYVNDQMIFGKIPKLTFRTYWTSNPERMAIEVIGLPEGFKEVKEELKMSILAQMDYLLPMTSENRFNGYQFSSQGNKEILAQDKSGLAPIPSYILKFDATDKLVEIIGRKPIGTFQILNNYEKDSFADGKWVLKTQTTTSSESGQTLTIKKVFTYGDSQGIGVLSKVNLSTLQKWDNPKIKSVEQEESLTYKNYKINAGEALKYFLGEQKK